MNKELARLLQKIGVDSRFVSILDDRIVVNNLRYSRFSRNREKIFYHKFPEITVIRSKMFQRIATRASRNLKAELKPKDRVAVIMDDGCATLTLHAVLEPYTRKYGIKIIKLGSWEELDHLDVDKVALALDMDKSSLYYYFKGIPEILNAILDKDVRIGDNVTIDYQGGPKPDACFGDWAEADRQARRVVQARPAAE